MTTLAQALENAYADIEAIMLAITPDAKPEHKFARRQPQDEVLRDLSASTGRARLFEVVEGELTLLRHLYTGGGTSGLEFAVPVDILYPAADPRDLASWHAAAASDYCRIAHRCLDTTTITGAGIMARMAWTSPKFTAVESDPWFVMRVVVQILLDVEQ